MSVPERGDMTQDGEAEYNDWLAKAQEELPPMIRGSACVMSLVPGGDPDAKFAVELGMSIMLDKPIIAIAEPGADLPKKLLAVADKVLYIKNLRTPGARKQMELAWRDLLGDDDDDAEG